MEILIGLAVLAIATALIIGCAYGNLFACVFSTLALVVPSVLLTSVAMSDWRPLYGALTLGLVALIWGPLLCQRHNAQLRRERDV